VAGGWNKSPSWAGLVADMRKTRNEYRILLGNPEDKRNT
jgi:hypothetical protein